MEKNETKPNIPVLEWAFSTVGVIIVVGILAFNIVQALNDRETPPDIQLKAEEPIRTTQGYLLPIEAVNVGGESAAALMIAGQLRSAEGEVESSEVTFDYVAPHSSKKGGLFFEHDPKVYQLKLRVLGYQEP
ncbi:MAG TPA: TIGR02588 family protein [Oligoflexus sp.]|uniref:TIGR02588 family protein n=1 Tax=Oligoflexus sp. TaxID=1971216 RepID=UPI002D80E7C0|nr:TIGR02588 family protein [Oligoflexus sp.]HET9241108.1 TIGR02588 family protein [Oligoflexus sp.]